MRIQDLMSADVVSVTPATTIGEARERMRIAEIGHLVVIDGKRSPESSRERTASTPAANNPSPKR